MYKVGISEALDLQVDSCLYFGENQLHFVNKY